MMRKSILLITAILLLITLIPHRSLYADTRIKDIVQINGWHDTRLFGYGLVVGLEGTGDSKNTQFTIQSLVNMLQRMGVTVPVRRVKVKNVAAVMVTAVLPPNSTKGSSIDVTVSSLGDASSLAGGTLLMTPLSATDGLVYAWAQGPISIGGFNVQVDVGNKIINNYTLVGTVTNGAIVEKEPVCEDIDLSTIQLSLMNPDYTTITRIKDKINGLYPGSAYPLDNSILEISVPYSMRNRAGWVDFIANIEKLKVEPDNKARVVVNERTGTIVAGANVSIGPVALAHGNITISISTLPIISQPAPFSPKGETVTTGESDITVNEEPARVIEIEERVNIYEVAQALNSIGAAPRDIIAIFQALKQTGALRAELIVL
jgi:flagellar P-ring protein precursor FlgI